MKEVRRTLRGPEDRQWHLFARCVKIGLRGVAVSVSLPLLGRRILGVHNNKIVVRQQLKEGCRPGPTGRSGRAVPDQQKSSGDGSDAGGREEGSVQGDTERGGGRERERERKVCVCVCVCVGEGGSHR